MNNILNPVSMSKVKLLPGILKDRAAVNHKYLMSLKNENLLQNHYLEAGIASFWGKKEDAHWGWESPSSAVRGHFIGHWLSAAANIHQTTGDKEIKAKADFIVSELARCQQENGGEWAAAIPEKVLKWTLTGKNVSVPHYNIHKNMMGLWDMYAYAGNQQALEVLTAWAEWFIRWTKELSQEQMDRILEIETGGMLEIWANLYGVTNKKEHLQLMRAYDRRFLFNRLIAGEDVLTNLHANTTIPEILGAARAYEVTGERRFRDAVEAYWRFAVTDRGYFCTGGQTNGEVWCPPFEQLNRLGPKTQEHCTVYNMMRLAECLLRWTGDLAYADYMERNLYNGVLAQQNAQTGMTTYFLPLEPGATKTWSKPTEDFWCCNGTMVQAQTVHESYIYYRDGDGIVIAQYFPSEWRESDGDNPICISQVIDSQGGIFSHVVDFDPGAVRKPDHVRIEMEVKCGALSEFAIKFRVPWWSAGEPRLFVNGIEESAVDRGANFIRIRRVWKNDRVRIEFSKKLTCYPLPDQPDIVAFMDGPIVLAGLIETDRILYGDTSKPVSILRTHEERLWAHWTSTFYTRNQDGNFKFIPLYEVIDEKYTVYFPIRNKE